MFIKLARKCQRKWFPSADQIVARKWFADQGDKTLRLDYPLNSQSVVLDLGGYEGQWASDIYARYLCQVHVFEPVPEYYERICRRFAGNSAIAVYPFGVGGATRTEQIAICGDSSSLYRQSDATQDIQIVDICHWCESTGVTHVDLLKVNIEGGEYELLRRLCESGWAARIRNIQVQFHRLDQQSEAEMKKLQAALQSTHAVDYQYPFVWESWKLMAA